MRARKKRDEKGSAALEIVMLATVTVLVTVMVAPFFSRAVNSAKKAADDGNIRAAYTEHLLSESSGEWEGDATVKGNTITFSDGTTYILQYYSQVKQEGKWIGVSY